MATMHVVSGIFRHLMVLCRYLLSWKKYCTMEATCISWRLLHIWTTCLSNQWIRYFSYLTSDTSLQILINKLSIWPWALNGFIVLGLYSITSCSFFSDLCSCRIFRYLLEVSHNSFCLSSYRKFSHQYY